MCKLASTLRRFCLTRDGGVLWVGFHGFTLGVLGLEGGDSSACFGLKKKKRKKEAVFS